MVGGKLISRDQIGIHLARKYNLDKDEVLRVIKSQFKLVKVVMERGNGEAVRLPNFGVWSVKPGRKAHIERLKKNKLERGEKIRDHTYYKEQAEKKGYVRGHVDLGPYFT
jgi:nucleoid DNA-binding protein